MIPKSRRRAHMNIEQLKQRPVVLHKSLLDHYSELGINETELVILIKLIYASEQSDKQPSIESLQQGSTLDARDISIIIQNLIQRDLLHLQVKKDEEGKFTEYMDLDPFYEQFNDILTHLDQQNDNEQQQLEFKQLFQQIEQTFGRTLSPYEIETLNHWIDVDQLDFSLIQAALNEAESNDKLSMKYIDRILLNWKKHNVKTVEEAKPIREKFDHKQPKKTQQVTHVPKIDWLNGGDSTDGK